MRFAKRALRSDRGDSTVIAKQLQFSMPAGYFSSVFMEDNGMLPIFPLRCNEHLGFVGESAGLVLKSVHKPSTKVFHLHQTVPPLPFLKHIAKAMSVFNMVCYAKLLVKLEIDVIVSLLKWVKTFLNGWNFEVIRTVLRRLNG